MKGNKKIITVLNQLLADELTAISQYMVHSEMCDSWGYDKLHKAIERQAMDEMHHAEWLIRRIIFLEGRRHLQTESDQDRADGGNGEQRPGGRGRSSARLQSGDR